MTDKWMLRIFMKEITKLGFEQHPTKGSNQNKIPIFYQHPVYFEVTLQVWSEGKYFRKADPHLAPPRICLHHPGIGYPGLQFFFRRLSLLGFTNLVLLVLNLFQSLEFLSFKLRDNVCKSPLNLGDDHMLYSIHPAVCGLDDLVQCDERCLQACKLYKQVDCLLIVRLKSKMWERRQIVFLIIHHEECKCIRRVR